MYSQAPPLKALPSHDLGEKSTLKPFLLHKSALLALLVVCVFIPHARAQFVQQGGKLVGSGSVGQGFQGNSMALSADGNTAISGGPDDNSDTGAAWIFTRSGGVWSQQGGALVGNGGSGRSGAHTGQGTSVALSGDGNTAIWGGWR